MLGDLFYRAGAAIGALDAHLRGVAPATGRSREVAVHEDAHDPHDALENAALAGAAAWLLARVFRPREISWPRVILAGVTATLLADFVGRTADEDGRAATLPYAEDPEELLARLGAGVAVAAGYASLLYPRIPGSPLFRGLAFGALEVAAAPRGGLIALASRAPGVKFPLQTLALPIDEDAGPLSHMAYGLGLGLFYRYDPDDE